MEGWHWFKLGPERITGNVAACTKCPLGVADGPRKWAPLLLLLLEAATGGTATTGAETVTASLSEATDTSSLSPKSLSYA